jgi:signal transduction histidine kinase
MATAFAGRDSLIWLPGLPPADRSGCSCWRNLLDNGCAMAGGNAGAAATRTGRRWQLIVRDHGPGVDAAALQRLGEPFYRPDAARSRDAGGVGLGLYLCRLVAQSHGGTLQWRLAAPGLEACLRLPMSASA